ncbi:MAG: hypothetical protein KGI06_00550 [Candidatus Micrarchaeota archaeon]|nr:hypothetical protein [Candidatus Micrarchaeota archaeon]
MASMPVANASYTVKNLNVTLVLNTNTSAQVTEVIRLSISNESVSQYSVDRAALNLTLSDWRAIIGPIVTDHIINPNSSVYNFKFFPGPVTRTGSGNYANITLLYSVSNVTFVNRIAPREYEYKFNSRIFNFEHGVSGEVLNPSTELTVILPHDGKIVSVYPIPDLPPYAFTTQYKNVTIISWLYGEPLSTFTLVYTIKESMPAEVEGFFTALYNGLGIYTYVIIALAVVLSVLYIYRRAVI